MVEEAKIFIAAERGYTETEWFRSYNTFNFGQYKNEHKIPFGNLYVLNDDTLAGGKSLRLFIEENTLQIIIPIVGTINYHDSLNNHSKIEAGEVQFISLPKETTIEIRNAYENELVNFLQLWIKGETLENKKRDILSFDATKKNTLQKISSGIINLYIGKFDGRKEATLKPSTEGNQLFVFIIQGAFEVQNRLLETRDGLSLTGIEELEFEALSNNAILFILEMPETAS